MSGDTTTYCAADSGRIHDRAPWTGWPIPCSGRAVGRNPLNEQRWEPYCRAHLATALVCAFMAGVAS